MPSEYFREHVYLTFQDDWVAFRMADLMNPERLMWANDFPHSDATWPNSQEMLAEHAAHLDDACGRASSTTTSRSSTASASDPSGVSWHRVLGGMSDVRPAEFAMLRFPRRVGARFVALVRADFAGVRRASSRS